MIDGAARPLVYRQNKRLFRAYLTEEYDGIGQYTQVALSRNSVSSGLRARIASGDFTTGAHYPRGTEVIVFSDHGQLEIITFGANPQSAVRAGLALSDPTASL